MPISVMVYRVTLSLDKTDKRDFNVFYKLVDKYKNGLKIHGPSNRVSFFLMYTMPALF